MLKLPSNTERYVGIGRTGSGKTQAGVWQLSLRDYDVTPWVIIDFKGDKLINDIPYSNHITLDDDIPEAPGIFIVQPVPGDVDDGRVDAFLLRIWERENCGLFIDECFMVGRFSRSLNAILTQGRSKHIPAILLTQKPSWVSQFVFSEADYFQIFHLNDTRDYKRVEQFVPYKFEQPLPEYNSIWYSVKKNKLLLLTPVEEAGTILARFEERLRPKEPETPEKPRKIAI